MVRKMDPLHLNAPSYPAYDLDEANRLIVEAFEVNGWVSVDTDGTLVKEHDKLKAALLNVFTSNHIVTRTAVKNNNGNFNELVADAAVTKYRLYIELFPSGPGAQTAPKNDEEAAARDAIASYVWRQCTPTNRNAWLQRELAASRVVVLETKVLSDDPGVAPEPGRYVTDVDSAMLDFLEHKVFEDVRRKVAEADAWLSTFYQRNPDIALPAAKKARMALKAAVDSAKYANPQYVKDSMALAAGDEDLAD